jgi:hypothetical protein
VVGRCRGRRGAGIGSTRAGGRRSSKTCNCGSDTAIAICCSERGGHGGGWGVQEERLRNLQAGPPGGGSASSGGGRGGRAFETRDRKVNRVQVDPGTDMLTDGLDERGDGDDDMPEPSYQEMLAHLLGNMAIPEATQRKVGVT